jgi:battenin
MRDVKHSIAFTMNNKASLDEKHEIILDNTDEETKTDNEDDDIGKEQQQQLEEDLFLIQLDQDTRQKEKERNREYKASTSSTSLRNLTAFFIAGLLNNYGYVLLLTAAEDLLHGYAGVILLCSIIPSLIVKATAPLYFHFIPYNIRVIALVVLSCASFQSIAWFDNVYIKLTGVVLSSISSGGGEVTFLQMSSYYHKNVVSTWSSGTGGAGILGAFTYLLLHGWMHLSPKSVMFISTFLPFLLLFSVFVLMTGNHAEYGFFSAGSGKKQLLDDDNMEKSTNPLTTTEKLKLILPLAVKFMFPLAIVYYMEYLINTAIAPNLSFKTGLITSNSYVYYMNIYQVGVFISRSSVNLFPIRRLWIPAILQTLNLVILFTDAYFRIIPSIWFIFMVIFWEGLLGGGIYVNTYYRMSVDIKPSHREFSMSIVSNADSLGIFLSGLTATFLQSWIRRHQSHRYI